MAIDLLDLQLLVDVDERGSFSQAAAVRGWSQPQVSQRIAMLEAELGVALFKRHRRGASLTPAGEVYIEAARRALAELDSGRLAIQGAAALPVANIACLPSLASVIFGPLLAALAEAPMEIHCKSDHSPAIMEQLLLGELQVGFVLNRPAVAGIQLELLARSPIVAVVAPRHALAQAGGLSLRDVAPYRISPQRWGDECDELVRQIRACRASPQPLHLNQPSVAARELALEHDFVVFMPEVCVLRELQAGALVKLRLADLPVWCWEVMMAYRTGKRPDFARDEVLAAARAIGGGWRRALSM
ncbi:LysR family transcriptional regulator [Parachitinimonas caeni]|uniref:LysR family transcriptional regulator n=1 Tax=Parachitinimonas caeni TaxID=3031301 RepID=A0ABT7DY23_9NEIS|nr:LysR family transcriptional regulator [Parachitinimonas caeni]MDK2124972.1 LysR family transcriptional regulator [Parachitinimonas caeni]